MKHSIVPPDLLTVTQLTHAIKLNLESAFPFVHIQGEISNFKVQSSGHFYFSLKDAQSQIDAVMFKGQASQLKILPKSGDQVVVKGELSVFPPRGNYQLIVRELGYVGLGQLLLALEELKIKLHQMGWFKSARKKAIPRLPRRIGVVTSPTGAVIQDIINILTRRFSGFHLILNPVKVQGEGAAEEIAQAIEQFNQYKLVDVIIVGRGGGSFEDLWAFNQEVVATAIFKSEIPVISAVGHETDHCIADYVSDLRAPTPSAAAEIVIAEKNRLIEHLQMCKRRMQHAIHQLIRQNRLRLKGIIFHPIMSNPYLLLEWRMQKLDDFRIEIDKRIKQVIDIKRQKLLGRMHHASALKPMSQIIHFKNRFSFYEQTFNQKIKDKLIHFKQYLKLLEESIISRKKEIIKQKELSLKHLIEMMQAVDPKNVLMKGYSILFAEKSPSVINSVLKLKKGDKAKLLLADGVALITINEVLPSESESNIIRS